MKLAILALAFTCTLVYPPRATGSIEASVTSSILGLTGTIIKTGFRMIEDRSEIEMPISLQEKEKKILHRINLVDQRISNMGHMIDNAKLETMYEIVTALTRTIKVELRFNDLLQYIDDIDYAYTQMQEYALHRDSVDRSTLEDFARSVVSHAIGSVRMQMERVHRFIVPRRKFLGHSTLLGLLATTKENESEETQQWGTGPYNLAELKSLKHSNCKIFFQVVQSITNFEQFVRKAVIPF